jgi:glycosyltransferase involved in cell wall biosynthesis
MVCSEFPPEGAGIGISVANQAQALVAEGHSVTVLTRGRRNIQESRNGVCVHRVCFAFLPPPVHLMLHGYFINRTIRRLIKNGSRFDLLHLHSPLIPRVRLTIPTITTVHSAWLEEAKSFDKISDLYSLYVKIFKKTFVWSERRTFRQSKFFTTTSHAMKREIAGGYGINEAQISVVPNIVDIKIYNSKNHKPAYDVVSVSRLVYRKGICDLIEAASIVQKRKPEVRFAIVGSGMLLPMLRRRVRSLGLTNNVFFLGRIDHGELSRYLAPNAIFVSPAHYEPFGLTTVEAMTARLPVVATNVGGSSELLEGGLRGTLVDPKNPQQIADAILTLVRLPKASLDEMGECAYRFVVEKFNPHTVTHQMLGAYQNVLNAHSRSVACDDASAIVTNIS